MYYFTFAELLGGFRKRSGLRQKDMVQLLDISVSTYKAWEVGNHLPRNREQVLRLKEPIYYPQVGFAL